VASRLPRMQRGKTVAHQSGVGWDVSTGGEGSTPVARILESTPEPHPHKQRTHKWAFYSVETKLSYQWPLTGADECICVFSSSFGQLGNSTIYIRRTPRNWIHVFSAAFPLGLEWRSR
jgi:hypothetical protein